jgi:CHAT domain
VLGWYCWLRYLARPAGHGEQDLTAAMRLLAPVFQANPATVPQSLQRWYLQAEASSLADRYLSGAGGAGGPGGSGGAVWPPPRRPERLPIFHGVVRSAVDAMHRDRDPRGRTERLLGFAMSLRGVAARGGDETVASEASEIAFAALGRTAGTTPVPAEPDRAFTPEAFLESMGGRPRPQPAAPVEYESVGSAWRSPPAGIGHAPAALGSASPPAIEARPAMRDSGPYRDRSPAAWDEDTGSDPYRSPDPYGAPNPYGNSDPYGSSDPYGGPARYAASAPAVLRTPAPAPTQPERHLWAQLSERVGVGQRIPLLVWVATTGSPGRSARMKPFDVPESGRGIVVSVSAPGFELMTDIEQELFVPPTGDSEPVRFGLRALTTGLHRVDVIAFAGGTFLGRLALQVSVEHGAALTEGFPRHIDLAEVAARPGEVTLQVNRENEHYSFQLIGSSWYPRVLTQSLAGNPAEVVERILAELRSMARGQSGYTSPAAVRERMRNLGTRLWSDVVPDAVRRQFWEQADNISSFVVMSNLDTVPWELLHAVDQGRPQLGFLAEHMPVVRRVYERRPTYRLPLPSAAYVVPPESPGDARAEVDDVRALLGRRVMDWGIVSRLDDLQGLFADPPGLLHFACHNSFSPMTGSLVKMHGGPVTPDDLEQSKRQLTMAAGSPLVFFNACRTAGEIYGFTQMSGWASQFMAAGAGGFVGTLWPVRSATARVFATSFYEGIVHQGATLGEASLLARKSVSEDLEDPTWLAYTVYGSPTARLAG